MIVDAHGHLGASAGYYFADTSLAGIISLMDHLGIDILVQAHQASLLAAEFRLGHEESVAAYEETGGRVRSLAVFNPHYPQESLQWAERSLAHRAYVGIKIHPSWHNCPAEDPRYDPVWRFADERHLPIVTHTWEPVEHNPLQSYAFPARFAGYVERYPNVALGMGHSGGRYRGHLAAIELAQRCPSVYLDLSGDTYWPRLVETFVKEVGADRVMFGSDVVWMDPRTQIGRILGADISMEDKALILGGNAQRLFKL